MIDQEKQSLGHQAAPGSLSAQARSLVEGLGGIAGGELPATPSGKLRITGDAEDWFAGHDGLGTSCYCGIRDESGTVVALSVAHAPDHGDPDCRSMARRIVRCVNLHDELLEALRGVQVIANTGALDAFFAEPWLQRVRAAINRAQEQS